MFKHETSILLEHVNFMNYLRLNRYRSYLAMCTNKLNVLVHQLLSVLSLRYPKSYSKRLRVKIKRISTSFFNYLKVNYMY